MQDRPPIPLTGKSINIHSPEFEVIKNWSFQDPFVTRLLNSDIPFRLAYQHCFLWVFFDPDDQLVGFGSLGICEEYTKDKSHCYIPLLAVNPHIKSKGYGETILRHLLDEATIWINSPGSTVDDCIFLDVYTFSQKAIELYTRIGFVTVADSIPDTAEGGKLFNVMAKNLRIEGR